ncbi:hypothetical protein K443DRAFT_682361 [Laccaria amethystina LaAM-08-1]|uniref:Uncharacterized protein n=1 Tax=Laccaria amethystina LaAM-08-1 TaxID=1095629 RepID=A0A0C9XFH0_9AGAR|nr:hypothetical protein K443DRAFT_682361 [Laccaria amethystina LaAM-08-1]
MFHSPSLRKLCRRCYTPKNAFRPLDGPGLYKIYCPLTVNGNNVHFPIRRRERDRPPGSVQRRNIILTVAIGAERWCASPPGNERGGGDISKQLGSWNVLDQYFAWQRMKF